LHPFRQPQETDSPAAFRLDTPGTVWHGLGRGVDFCGQASRRTLPLLLIHGTAGSSHCWRPVLHRLAPEIEVLAPDLPGHGQTGCARHRRHGIDEMAHDLATLLSQLGFERVEVVAGHSAGAAIGLALALGESALDMKRAAPESGRAPAIEIGTVFGIAPSLVPPPALYTLMLGPLLAPLVGSAASIAAASLLTRTTRTADRLLDSTGSEICETQRADYRKLLASRTHLQGAVDFMAATRLPGLLEKLQALRCDTHFLLAEDDPWIPSGRLREVIERHLPGAGIESCRGGHLLPESRPERVAERVAAML
jgi:magnesium chelatase accessory protein